jgi:type IV secretion system protein VirB1
MLLFLAVPALSHLLQSCAPNIGPRTMTAIVHVESGGNSLAVRDNTLNRAFYPKTREEAVRLADYLLAKRHNLDLGISQVNSANFPGLGMSVSEAFDPCTNLRNGASILAGAYRRAVTQFGPGQYALRRAIGAYNTGSLYAGDRYISMILDAAGVHDSVVDVARVPNLTPESQAHSQSQEASKPARPVQAPIIVHSEAVHVSPENSPILVSLQGHSPAALVSTNQQMTHISVNQTALMHIPIVRTGEPQQSTSPDPTSVQDNAPIVLRLRPAQMTQGTMTPQQQLLQEAAAMERSRGL